MFKTPQSARFCLLSPSKEGGASFSMGTDRMSAMVVVATGTTTMTDWAPHLPSSPPPVCNVVMATSPSLENGSEDNPSSSTLSSAMPVGHDSCPPQFTSSSSGGHSLPPSSSTLRDLCWCVTSSPTPSWNLLNSSCRHAPVSNWPGICWAHSLRRLSSSSWDDTS